MENKTYFFDHLITRDGHDLYWLYSRTPSDYKFVEGTRFPTNTIDPDDLYVNEFEFYEACRDIVLDKKNYENYSVPDAYLLEWEMERDEPNNK